MKLKRLAVLFVVIGFVTTSAFTQSVKPRAGEYLFESSTALHWVRIEDEGNDRYEISIVSTNNAFKDGVMISGAYWRPGSGAIEFIYNGRTVQIRAESGGRSISCTLFGSVVLRRQ
jgi:hypothetical protein